MSAPYIALAVVTAWMIAGVLVALVVGQAVTRGDCDLDDPLPNDDTPAEDPADVAVMRVIHAADTIYDALVEWENAELDGDDYVEACAIAHARNYVSHLRDRTAGVA